MISLEDVVEKLAVYAVRNVNRRSLHIHHQCDLSFVIEYMILLDAIIDNPKCSQAQSCFSLLLVKVIFIIVLVSDSILV